MNRMAGLEVEGVMLHEDGWHPFEDVGDRIATNNNTEERHFSKIPLMMVRNAGLSKLQLLKLRIEYGEDFPAGLQVKVIIDRDNGPRPIFEYSIQEDDTYDSRGLPAQGMLTGQMGRRNIIRGIRVIISHPNQDHFDISNKRISITYRVLGTLNIGAMIFGDDDLPM